MEPGGAGILRLYQYLYRRGGFHVRRVDPGDGGSQEVL